MSGATPDRGSSVPGHIRVPTAARRTGLSIRDLYDRIDTGALAAVRDEHGMIVVPEEALDSLDA